MTTDQARGTDADKLLAEWAKHVASERENFGFDNYIAFIEAKLHEAYQLGAARVQELEAEKEADRLRKAALQDSIDGAARHIAKLKTRAEAAEAKVQVLEANQQTVLDRELELEQQVQELEKAAHRDSVFMYTHKDMQAVKAQIAALEREVAELLEERNAMARDLGCPERKRAAP